jgi:hypothetical protein
MAVEFENDNANASAPLRPMYTNIHISLDSSRQTPGFVRLIMKMGIKNEQHAIRMLVAISIIFILISIGIAVAILAPNYLGKVGGASRSQINMGENVEIIKVPNHNGK